MKPKLIISIFILFLLLSCSGQEEINVLFENGKTVEYTMKRLDTFHKHKCKTKKLTDVKTQVTFKICNEYFVSDKATGIISIANKGFQKSNPISLKDFLENYSHLRGAIKENKVFFYEKSDSNTYQRYSVKWSKDFRHYEPSQGKFEKF
ncbi:MAG: hypothetical protein AB8B65_08105 [Kordia sp.]|uniref:hypothetical protein n=1 Tax=Kordia sp. TaxID=1965332 RepID=UPI00385EF6D9